MRYGSDGARRSSPSGARGVDLRQELAEESLGSWYAAIAAQQEFDSLAVLVNGPIPLAPPATDLHAGLVDAPRCSHGLEQVAPAFLEFRDESLDPAPDRRGVHVETPVSQHLKCLGDLAGMRCTSARPGRSHPPHGDGTETWNRGDCGGGEPASGGVNDPSRYPLPQQILPPIGGNLPLN